MRARAQLEAELAKCEAAIDAAYWCFTRQARAKPPVLVVPWAYARRKEIQAELARLSQSEEVMMNTEEQAIAKIVLERAQQAGRTPQFRDLSKVTEVVVKLNDDGTYDYVSGPEYHTLGTPRRRRLVWAVRRGVRDGVAAGGFSWAATRDAAVGQLRAR